LTGHLARAIRIPRLTAEDETELATRTRAGRRAEEKLAEGGDALTAEARANLEQMAVDGDQAGSRLREANGWLVVSIAERYTGRGVPFQDLLQAGSRGLTRAIQRYDHTKGYPFTAFATWWIRQAITRALAGPPRASQTPEPGSGATDTDRLTQTEQRMLQALGREPTAEELAAELDPSSP
jgi:RNA polymerase primary sigma factor